MDQHTPVEKFRRALPAKTPLQLWTRLHHKRIRSASGAFRGCSEQRSCVSTTTMANAAAWTADGPVLRNIGNLRDRGATKGGEILPETTTRYCVSLGANPQRLMGRRLWGSSVNGPKVDQPVFRPGPPDRVGTSGIGFADTVVAGKGKRHPNPSLERTFPCDIPVGQPAGRSRRRSP